MRARLILLYLIFNPNKRLEKWQVYGEIWPDWDPDSKEIDVERAVREAISQIRKALEPDISRKESFIRTGERKVYIEDISEFYVDVIEFDKLRHKSRQADSEERLPILLQAHELYVEDVLEGYEDDWSRGLRNSYQDKFLELLNDIAGEFAQQDNFNRAIQYWELSLDRVPYQPSIHHDLINGYLELQQLSNAKRACERALLLDELDEHFEVLPETRSLSIDLQELSRSEIFRRYARSSESTRLVKSRFQSGFVNRHAEIAALSKSWNQVLAGTGSAAVLAGDAGIGKTRIADQFEAYAMGEDVIFLRDKRYEKSEASPFESLIEAIRNGLRGWNQLPGALEKSLLDQVPERFLREVVKEVPEIKDQFPEITPTPSLEDPKEERRRRLEALCHFFLSITEKQPLILFLDDLQWADESTLDAVEYIVPKLHDSQLFLLGAFREGEVRPDHHLRKMMDNFNRDGIMPKVAVDPMSSADIEQMATNLLDSESLGDISNLVSSRAKGNPLFAEELIHTLHDMGALMQSDDGSWQLHDGRNLNEVIPTKVESTIRGRIGRMPSATKRILELTAVMGHDFSAELIEEIEGSEGPDFHESLDDLVWKRFLVYQEGDFRFRHDEYKKVAYESLMPASRERLHARVGGALESLYKERKDKIERGIHGEIARHFDEANQIKRALPYYIMAGDHVWTKKYAKNDALCFYERAEEIAEQLGDEINLMRACKGIGEVCATTDEQDRGLEYCEKALEICDEPEARADIYLSIASVWHNKRELETGLTYCERAIAELEPESKSALAIKAYYRASTFCNWLLEHEAAINYCQKALSFLDQFPSKNDAALVLSELGHALSASGLYEEAVGHLEESARLSKEIADPLTIGLAYFKLGIALNNAHKTTAAIEAWHECLEHLSDLVGRHSDLSTIYSHLVHAYCKLRNMTLAMEFAHLQLQESQLSGDSTSIALSHAVLGCLLEVDMQQPLSDEHFERAKEIEQSSDLPHFGSILTYLYLDELDKALACLQSTWHLLKPRRFEYLNSCPTYTEAFEQFRKHKAFLQVLSTVLK